jgi:putative ATP-binding cassette transporter
MRQLLQLGDEEYSDDDIIQALGAARLATLVERYGIDSSADWEAIISPGERQRIAFARLLLHKPAVALLDEATSALTEADEELLYASLDAPVVISVGHRPSLKRSHTHSLHCAGEGKWDLSTLEDVDLGAIGSLEPLSIK